MNELAIAVVSAKCAKNRQTFGISYRQVIRGEWLAYWTFPLTDSTSQREGYADTQLDGVCKFDAHYPGCPYCKTTGLVQCGNCKHISCWDSSHKEFSCAWCGNSGVIGEMADFRNLSGSHDL
ncbi:MAG: hypothetical protein AB9897_02975 [Anaerolineaceae bacterium]